MVRTEVGYELHDHSRNDQDEDYSCLGLVMWIVMHVLGNTRQSNYPQNIVADALPEQTPVSEKLTCNADEREEEDKQKVVQRISHSKEANQLLFLLSFMCMRFEAQYPAEQ